MRADEWLSARIAMMMMKTHPKAAVLVMAGLNSGLACIVRSNLRLATDGGT